MTSRRGSLESLLVSMDVQEQQKKATHAGLWLDKYITAQEREKTDARHTLVQEVASLLVPELYGKYYARWGTMLEEQRASTHPALVEGRMVVGLGDESVLETSVALHHTYGVPYIPGSALKGLAANYAHQRLGAAWHKGGEAHTAVFGDTDHAGYVTFFDALYIPNTAIKRKGQHEDKVLYPDIITVHHPEYYKGDTNPPAPADWDSPTPIPLLSATGKYLLALTAPDLADSNEWLKHTFKILAHALHEHGIGAKTSSGYGHMRVEGFEIITESEKAVQASLSIPEPPSLVTYTRPNIQLPVSGKGRVTPPPDELRAIAPEATHWIPDKEKLCTFVSEEARNGCTVLICEPVVEKKKNNNKKK